VLHPAIGRLWGEGDGVDFGPVRAATLAGNRAGAAELVPQPVADLFVAHGGVDACTARVDEYRAAGVDLPVLFPMPVSGTWDFDGVIERFRFIERKGEANVVG
jgi:5,10-methylenetetrahydromethanopterin reductase